MRQTIARLKAIFSTNIHFFVAAAILTSLIYIGLFWGTEVTKIMDGFVFTSLWQVVAALSLFAIPVVSYLLLVVSDHSLGIAASQVDTKVVKRNLFIAAGVAWASAGCFTVSVLSPLASSIMLISAVGFLLAWAFIFRLLFSYVRTV